MNRTIVKTGVLLAAVLFTAVASGAKSLGQAEAEQLVKGSTAEGVNRWNKQMIWYFDASGEVRKKDNRGNKGKAAWNIDKKGQLCYQDKQDRDFKCGPIVPRGEGKYDVDLPAAWKWNKVTPGNPHNL